MIRARNAFPKVVAGGLLIIAAGAHARASDFNFSITVNTQGNVNGTVTGEIDGLSANGTGPASNVFIDSIPPGLQNDSGMALPIDVLATADPSQLFSNSFTTAGGEITAADFNAVSVDGEIGLSLDFGGQNFVSLDADQTDEANELGFAGVTYTPITPEPTALSLIGLGAIGLLGRRRRS